MKINQQRIRLIKRRRRPKPNEKQRNLRTRNMNPVFHHPPESYQSQRPNHMARGPHLQPHLLNGKAPEILLLPFDDGQIVERGMPSEVPVYDVAHCEG